MPRLKMMSLHKRIVIGKFLLGYSLFHMIIQVFYIAAHKCTSGYLNIVSLKLRKHILGVITSNRVHFEQIFYPCFDSYFP